MSVKEHEKDVGVEQKDGKSVRNLSREGVGRLRSAMQVHVDSGEVAGLVALLSAGDEIASVEAGVQSLETQVPMRADTIFRISSMTKPILAAAAMILVEEGRVGLDDPVDRWLPELANPKVLRTPGSALDDTVPAKRGITLRDLLTLRLGTGIIMEPPGTYPIQQPLQGAGASRPFDPAHGPDEVMRRLGALPLLHQPGEGWMYHAGFVVLAILIERIVGTPLEDFLARRILAPLGMTDTSFMVTQQALERFSTCYANHPESGELVVWDEARTGRWSRPSVFPAALDLVSTAEDYLSFCRMLLGGGAWGTKRILSEESVAEMTRDHITQKQKAEFPFYPGFWDHIGWGLGVSVLTHSDGVARGPGRYGWSGGTGPMFFVDPDEGLIAILVIQRMMSGPDSDRIGEEFTRLAYQALG